MSKDDAEYLLIDIENANLTKNTQVLGMGKMDPFVTLATKATTTAVEKTTIVLTRTPTHWCAHKEPIWFHECPRIPSTNKGTTLSFTVFNDSQSGLHAPLKIACADITIGDLLKQAQSSKQGSLGLACNVQLPLSDNAGTLGLRLKVKDFESFRRSQLAQAMAKHVDPSWFESPVERLGVSGGTAPFFKLTLKDSGLEQAQQSDKLSSRTRNMTKSYFIGKDLSHAEDEREFYEQILQIQAEGGEQDGVALLAPFMFDYLGVLEATTAEEGDYPGAMTQQKCQLLVMQNLRNDYRTFRMLDLKMGQQTAQGGWQGKSHVAAFRQSLLDGITNSSTEGYRLEGFDGCPERVNSMDPWIDLLARTPEGNETTSKTTVWGRQVTESDVKKAKRIMMQTMKGDDIMRIFMDVHLDLDGSKLANVSPGNTYMPVEVAEIVLHELVEKLVHLAVTCYRVQVPQKWIGSSVALGYDAGLFPERTSPEEAEQSIRSKVIVNVFDWGRSELLTRRRYKAMTAVEQNDRQRFWANYKNGMAQLAYNATRAYYHHFATNSRWTELTLQVMDFDSMTADDYIGQVTIALPDLSDTAARQSLQASSMYVLSGHRGPCGTIYCSISWMEFPAESRLRGTWRVTIERAVDLPVMDSNNSSDPYCVVIARDGYGDSSKEGVPCRRELHQMTCVKARSLNPVWNETIDLPIVKERYTSSLTDTLTAKKVMDASSSSPPTDQQMAELFQSNTSAEWSTRLQMAA